MLDVGRVSGLQLYIINENVGTGDSSTSSFDLDNEKIIDGSYTLYYATSGSNDFTQLTETTHYTLDNLSGRINLTAAGVILVSTNIIYADYKYWGSELVDDEVITSFIGEAEYEVEILTGKTYDTPTSVTEYFDGSKNVWLNYPTTDEPYMKDYDRPDFITLHYIPVTEITKVYFLDRGRGWSNVSSYDGSAYTDNTSYANDVASTTFYVFSTLAKADDIIYFGSSNKFLGIITNLTTVGVSNDEFVVWEYYNGSSWVTFTPTDTTSGAKSFTASGKFTWSMLANWNKTTVNSSTSLYFVRARIESGNFTTVPIADEITLDQDSAIDTEISIKSIDFTPQGRLTFLDNPLSSGVRNIRVDYKYGSNSVPSLIKELTALLVSVRAYAAVTGGSYDAMTSYTLGSKAVTIGEQYVNVREVVNQFQDRISRLLNIIGERVDLEVI